MTTAVDPSIAVREARADELATAGSIVADAYLRIVGDRHADYLDRIRDAESRARDCPILVAVDGAGTVLGCVTYVPGPGNPYAELEVDGEAGFRMLGVAPAAQGRGIGERLVLACLDRARAEGRRGIAISSSTEFRGSHRLYRRLGFRRAPDRDFAPIPGVHLLAFVFDLAPASGASRDAE
jgi:predicted N-acetyltransferase YhbS